MHHLNKPEANECCDDQNHDDVSLTNRVPRSFWAFPFRHGFL